MKCANRYATAEETREAAFAAIDRVLAEMYVTYQCPDLSEDNRKRFPWFAATGRRPEMPASRHWEYPWAVIESRVGRGMRVCDIGCGRTPFMFFLREMGCDVTAVDPLIGTTPEGNNFGVPAEWVENHKEISFVRGTLAATTMPSETFDRVFCLSVIEHLDSIDDRRAGMREIARILKPGGMAVISVDCLLSDARMTNFFDLIHSSGLLLDGSSDFRVPTDPFSTTDDGITRQEVFGFILRKEPAAIRYPRPGGGEASVTHGDLPVLRHHAAMASIKRDLMGGGRRPSFYGAIKFLAKVIVGKYRDFFDALH